MARIGAEGCYFLSIIHAAEIITGNRIDAVEVYENFVRYGYMGGDCYINSPDKIFSALTGRRCAVSKESADYAPVGEEVKILRYDWDGLSHFVYCGQSVDITYDPYGDSKTVQNGKPVSSRVFRFVL
jgi:hypothetical protein